MLFFCNRLYLLTIRKDIVLLRDQADCIELDLQMICHHPDEYEEDGKCTIRGEILN